MTYDEMISLMWFFGIFAVPLISFFWIRFVHKIDARVHNQTQMILRQDRMIKLLEETLHEVKKTAIKL
jgi:hypothetical protein